MARAGPRLVYLLMALASLRCWRGWANLSRPPKRQVAARFLCRRDDLRLRGFRAFSLFVTVAGAPGAALCA